ncbi:carbonic anhydrase family protein [Endozoicomonas arenosclerae]|uniref:carbonic anhydrase family protein n=1 Tax=Endozoicomonas arenosclerae TaxID=1633495 RepID=UPI0007840688|nr:carbonic anhydrase family protein [Endozoicomonas arenosclerae]
MKHFIFAAALCASSTTVLAAGSSWSYGGTEGPEYWGDLSNKYELCKTGKNQSPINLDHFIEADLKPLEINYSIFQS